MNYSKVLTWGHQTLPIILWDPKRQTHWRIGSAKKIPTIGSDMTDPVFFNFFLYVVFFLVVVLVKQ